MLDFFANHSEETKTPNALLKYIEKKNDDPNQHFGQTQMTLNGLGPHVHVPHLSGDYAGQVTLCPAVRPYPSKT
ncbi:unnamed protein product [Rotaria sp. Silwood2]|nr:unnamed protein product [Rotaria sp. Silwood2]CAF3262368.1 unnamed protein product [Rotaria sp. Silwood2]CAF3870864.1 unnamed protein product [Rotaria sp. Silwood2]CAF4272934.1 unnamed protein product [Rotaria sp. Silwood2]